jgi:hypothetical protein
MPSFVSQRALRKDRLNKVDCEQFGKRKVKP